MKTKLCHHCGEQIVWNITWPDKRNSHWAHAIRVFNGKNHTLENALMNQRCADDRHWATPQRNTKRYCDMCGKITDHVLPMCPGLNGNQL